MNAFSRSWNLTKLSFRVIGQDRELLLFPFIGMLLSVAYLAALLVPTIVLELLDTGSVEWTVVDYVVTFICYLGLAFIATFTNMCVVFTAKTRFAGGDATFGQSLSFTLGRIHQVLGWATVSATVGVVFTILDDVASRMGGIGKIVVSILRGLLEMAWGTITLFVVPSMVYRNTGPIDAVGDSVRVLRKTWGESLVRAVSFGLIEFATFALAIGLFGGMFMGQSALGASTTAMLALGAVAMVVLLGLVFVFMLARMIFNTALYAYASEGTLPAGYDPAVLDAAFRPRP